MSQDRWDRDYLDLAQWWADKRSKDPSTKVGAVITNAHNEVVSLAFNGFPPGVPDDPDLYADRDTKYRLVAHAERNALDLAKGDVAGGTLYTSPLPICHECAKSISQRRLSRVVISGGQINNPRWAQSWATSRHILECRGIEIHIQE